LVAISPRRAKLGGLSRGMRSAGTPPPTPAAGAPPAGPWQEPNWVYSYVSPHMVNDNIAGYRLETFTIQELLQSVTPLTPSVPTARILTMLRTSGFYGVLCWSAGSACSKAQVRRVPFRKRRSLIRVQHESVNSNRPEFLPTVRYRQSIRHRSRLTISNRKAPPSAGLLFNSSFVPSPTTFITF
jgi:hypothetical protein